MLVDHQSCQSNDHAVQSGLKKNLMTCRSQKQTDVRELVLECFLATSEKTKTTTFAFCLISHKTIKNEEIKKRKEIKTMWAEKIKNFTTNTTVSLHGKETRTQFNKVVNYRSSLSENFFLRFTESF